MTVTGPGSVRLVSGRRIVVIAAIAGTILSIVAGLTSRTLWLALGGAQPLPARLYGAAVWPDHTRRPPALGLPDQNGQVFSLPAQAGQAVGVTFMNPACTSCQGRARSLDTARAESRNTSSLAGVLSRAPPSGATMTQLSPGWVTEAAGADEHPQAATAHAAMTARRRVT